MDEDLAMIEGERDLRTTSHASTGIITQIRLTACETPATQLSIENWQEGRPKP